MRSAHVRKYPWLVGIIALFGGVVLGRWIVRQRRSKGPLVPVATSRKLVAYQQPGLPVPIGATAIRSARNVWIGPLLVALAVALAAGALAYRDGRVRHRVEAATGGVAARAIPIMLANGCGGCHTIPGVPGAQGLVGPRLDATLSSRVYLAGVLPNDRENMIRFLRSARELVPHTAMPSTGISEQDARDVAAYLYALR